VRFFTIGYGGRSPQDFVALLLQHGVRTVVDVRLRPEFSSMGVYARAKRPDRGIEALLTAAGIGYVSKIQLGNVFMDREDWRTRYQDLLDRAGHLLVTGLEQIPGPIALMCAEKRVAGCHRGLIADWMVANGWEVTHIE
jgi:uncharacterized protein (DUF488 family)